MDQHKMQATGNGIVYYCPCRRSTYEPVTENAPPELTDAGLSLQTFKTGIAVDIQGNSHAPEDNPHGCVCVGPAHVPGIGAVILMTVIAPDGTTQMVTMNAQGFGQVGAAFNQAARRIMAGEFAEPSKWVLDRGAETEEIVVSEREQAALSAAPSAQQGWRSDMENAPRDGQLVDLKVGPIVNLGCVWENTKAGGRWLIEKGDYEPTIEPREWRIPTGEWVSQWHKYSIDTDTPTAQPAPKNNEALAGELEELVNEFGVVEVSLAGEDLVWRPDGRESEVWENFKALRGEGGA